MLEYNQPSGIHFSSCSRMVVIKHVGQALPLGPVTVMAGVQSSPVTVSGGLQTSLSGVDLGYAVITHPQLDLTHQFGVTYDF